ncbi:MAG: sodium:phosphate symporter [Deltaproteobacteria bacterium CG11_big_fil_rev_8_21_14_0_20_45_16]|nr:MAG: sodium:phosphate symporter [Deltaproteobacteria bacterium CG11_big_fil_rev_8_21_14_0_20_45_16]
MLAIDTWKFIAGLGLFLFAITLVEESLKYLAGRSFKKLLRKHTNTHAKAILVGTVSTAVLQSSSAVTLMLLALVGSGMIGLSNALGIVFGANLGTTFTGWIVSSLGFEFHIGDAVLPLIAVGSLAYVLLNRRKNIAELGKLIIAFGLLFYGLNMMKESLSDFQSGFNLSDFQSNGIYSFALAGFLFTSIIQSSSASMVLALTALNANIIPLHTAAAFVVGADLGTTITVILGAVRGTAEKKQVAASHFIFNLVTTSLALAFLPWLLSFAQYVVGETRPLYALVFFQSSFNALGILLFWPFLGRFARFLEKLFIAKRDESFLLDIDPRQPEAGLESLLSSAKEIVARARELNHFAVLGKVEKSKLQALWNNEDSYSERYVQLKANEAMLIDYSSKLQAETLHPEQALNLRQILSGLRSSIISVKCIKDIRHNLNEFKNSSNDEVHGIFEEMASRFLKLYESFDSLLAPRELPLAFENLAQSLNEIERDYSNFISRINDLIRNGSLPLKHIPNIFNANREFYNSHRAMVFAISDIWLAPDESEKLAQLPIPH